MSVFASMLGARPSERTTPFTLRGCIWLPGGLSVILRVAWRGSALENHGDFTNNHRLCWDAFPVNKPTSPAQEPPQRTGPIRVAIVEDNEDARELFRRAVVKSPGLSCVGAFVTGEAALRELPSLLPDLVLMDIHLPGINGIECMLEIRKSQPTLKVVVVTSEHGDDYLFTALRAGADGYVTKPCDRVRLARVIAETMAGGRPIASDMTGHLVQAAMNPPKRRLPSHPRLSSRENEVLGLIAQGMGNKEAAEQLGLSVSTVNAHLQSIYGKLGVQNRVEALRLVAEQ